MSLAPPPLAMYTPCLKCLTTLFPPFSDDHVKFFCFQVLEHQIKFR